MEVPSGPSPFGESMLAGCQMMGGGVEAMHPCLARLVREGIKEVRRPAPVALVRRVSSMCLHLRAVALGSSRGNATGRRGGFERDWTLGRGARSEL